MTWLGVEGSGLALWDEEENERKVTHLCGKTNADAKSTALVQFDSLFLQRFVRNGLRGLIISSTQTTFTFAGVESVR